VALGALAWGSIAFLSASPEAPPPRPYHSPIDVSYSPDGKSIAVADHTTPALFLVDPAAGRLAMEVRLGGQPKAVAWAADGTKVYATLYDTASVAEINAADGKILRQIKTAPYPNGVAVAAKKQLLLVSDTIFANVRVYDLASGQEKAAIRTVREPFWISVTPDESMAVVSNLLPLMNASEASVTSCVSLIDLNSMANVADIKLPPNSTAVRQTAVSPDGRWAYVVHTVGRTMLPATQLERGWVNTNAMSIIDLKAKSVYATVLLDLLSEGAADPWGVALAKDGSTMWITLAGPHQVARIDLAGLHKNLESTATTAPAAGATAAAARSYSSAQIWAEIKKDPARRADLVNDLAALYVANLITRTNIPCKGPRGISLSPDGKQLAVGGYFSGDVLLIDPATTKTTATIAVGPKQEMDQVRRGEFVFHDAHHAFQHWLSCATCHHNDARVDGLNWDLPNDGLGNPKNARSLLWAYKTPPMMSMGVRDDMDQAVAAGFRFQMHQPPEEDIKAVQAYLRSLRPLKSPYRLPSGDLTEKAKKGKAIFEKDDVGCANCHSGEAFTNLKQYNVGSQGPLDHKDQDTFDTPTLIELWRTAPYLHDGRAVTLQQVFTDFNKEDKHGRTSKLSKDDLDALVEYLLSL
jgi:YVTN family beta-propeller protein